MSGYASQQAAQLPTVVPVQTGKKQVGKGG
jgi:hypothetical protein